MSTKLAWTPHGLVTVAELEQMLSKESYEKDFPLCACGCGQRVEKRGYRFIVGHYRHTKEIKAYLSKIKMGKRMVQRVMLNCPHCGKTIEMTKADHERRIKSSRLGHIFCSLKCMANWRVEQGIWKNPMNNPFSREKVSQGVLRSFREHPERRERMSIKRKKALQQGPIGCYGLKGDKNPAKRPEVRKKIKAGVIRAKCGEKGRRAMAGNRVLDTWIEKRVVKLLKDLGLIKDVDFLIKPYIKTSKTYRFPDVVLTIHKLIIEADGEEWHKEKDVKRDKEFVELGYRVLHLSGKVIRNQYPLKDYIEEQLNEKFVVKYVGMKVK